MAVSEEQLKEDRAKIKTQAEKIREKLKKELEEVTKFVICYGFRLNDSRSGFPGVFKEVHVKVFRITRFTFHRF